MKIIKLFEDYINGIKANSEIIGNSSNSLDGKAFLAAISTIGFNHNKIEEIVNDEVLENGEVIKEFKPIWFTKIHKDFIINNLDKPNSKIKTILKFNGQEYTMYLPHKLALIRDYDI